MATESSEGKNTAFRALVRHLNEANRVAEVDADSVLSQYKMGVLRRQPHRRQA